MEKRGVNPKDRLLPTVRTNWVAEKEPQWSIGSTLDPARDVWSKLK